MLSVSQARDKAEKLIDQARAAGAEAADAVYVGERSSGVQVRKGALEDVHRSEGEEMGLRVCLGSKSASVASSDLGDEALAALVRQIAHTTPRNGEWEQTYRALQARALRALERCRSVSA